MSGTHFPFSTPFIHILSSLARILITIKLNRTRDSFNWFFFCFLLWHFFCVRSLDRRFYFEIENSMNNRTKKKIGFYKMKKNVRNKKVFLINSEFWFRHFPLIQFYLFSVFRSLTIFILIRVNLFALLSFRSFVQFPHDLWPLTHIIAALSAW